MSSDKYLIYANDARREILSTEPKLAYLIDHIKPVDAVEVIHGRWEGIEFDMFYKCSNCWLIVEHELSAYCPKCGAKMDGKDNVPRMDGEDNAT